MFTEILGQEKAVRQLKKYLAAGKIPQAMLFCGAEGVGKAKTAKNFAMALNCTDEAARKTGDACHICQNCRSILNGVHPDYIFLDLAYQATMPFKDAEKKQHIVVDAIRIVTARSLQHAVLGRYKVIIIDKAESMQSEAANALLKFIEEPPPDMVWILVSSKKEAMLPTIKSRCQTLQFNNLPDETVKQILETQGFEESSAARAAAASGGSISRAVKAAEFFTNIAVADAAKETFPYEVVSNLSRTLPDARAEASLALDILARGLHDFWSKAQNDKIREDLKQKLEKIAFFKRAVRRNVSPALVLETALIETADLNEKIFK